MKDPKHASLSQFGRRAVSRREFLYGLGATIGATAFSSLLADGPTPLGPLAPKAPMLPTKVKSVIWVTMEGGPSHIDTFDPKPKLGELHLSKFVREGEGF